MNTFKRLIAVRHCEDCSDDELDELSPSGVEQAKNLACVIRDTLANTNSCIVLSSPLGRATMTANLIAEQLKAKVVVVNELELDDHHHGTRQVDAIKSFMEDHESVIVITHFEAPSGIMNALSKRFFGKSYESVAAKKGRGFVFDGMSGEIKRVP